MDIVFNNMTFIWLLLLVGFSVIELVTNQLVSIWFAGGSLVSFILAICGISTNIQIIVFVIISIILLAITYPLYRKYIKSDIHKLNADSLIGEKSIVIKEINGQTKESGQVKVKGQIWSAKTDFNVIFKKDDQVKIEKIEGVHVFVAPIITQEKEV